MFKYWLWLYRLSSLNPYEKIGVCMRQAVYTLVVLALVSCEL